MNCQSRLLLLIALLAALGTARPDAMPPEGERREDPLEHNRRLLEKWKTDPEHSTRLRRDLEEFWAMPPERRALLRQLDRDLHRQDPATQARLWNVLERYHAWLRRLPREDRRRVEAAGDWRERLRIVEGLREKEFVARLPQPVRNRVAALKGKERADLIARLREERRERRRQALAAPGGGGRRRDKPVKLTDFPPDVQAYVRASLKPLLPPRERQRLEAAEGKWPGYARTLHKLARDYPVPLPGPVGYVRVADLPGRVQVKLRQFPRAKERLQRAEGKWPEFGEALLAVQGEVRKTLLPPRFTPAAPGEFPDEVKDFINKTLLKKLSGQEKERLRRTEGKWPQYPRTLLELSNKYGLTVPGMALPGPKNLWNRATSALPTRQTEQLRGCPPALPCFFRAGELQ